MEDWMHGKMNGCIRIRSNLIGPRELMLETA